ncbi:MAG TPA: radical SAM protein, partial [Bacteroidales bacterium]|nr:radical SAM protein [Bacteroidales bacterium]
MYDKFNRRIHYLRISVTDRCNYRCTYCMPAEGVKLMSHNDILSYDEILAFVTEAAKRGVDKVRLTGGEPLVRKGIEYLVEGIAKIPGITDFGMTTNGFYLAEKAQMLADAGLMRINISLDTMDPEEFKRITRLGNIEDVFRGIEAAKKAGLQPIKINCVIEKSEDEPNAQAVTKFCEENGLKIRYIRKMDLDKGEFWQVKGGEGGKCSTCNRLRLTADGKIRPC